MDKLVVGLLLVSALIVILVQAIVKHKKNKRYLIGVKKAQEELEKTKEQRRQDKEKFLETMKELGFNDPVRQILDATRGTKIKWWLTHFEDPDAETGFAIEVKSFKASLFDGIYAVADKESWYIDGIELTAYSLVFGDIKKRFDRVDYVCGEPPDPDKEDNLLVKEYLDYLIKRFPQPADSKQVKP